MCFQGGGRWMRKQRIWNQMVRCLLCFVFIVSQVQMPIYANETETYEVEKAKAKPRFLPHEDVYFTQGDTGTFDAYFQGEGFVDVVPYSVSVVYGGKTSDLIIASATKYNEKYTKTYALDAMYDTAKAACYEVTIKGSGNSVNEAIPEQPYYKVYIIGVRSVQITPIGEYVSPGSSIPLKAEMETVETQEHTIDNRKIIWELSNNVSPSTKIENGMLFIGADETADTLKIKASSDFTANKGVEVFDEIEVKVKNIPYIEFDSAISTGALKGTFENELPVKVTAKDF